MMLGHVGFSTCTGCCAPSECLPHAACMIKRTFKPLPVVQPILATGWLCPRCQVVHAPSVQRCTCQAAHVHPVYQD